MFLSKMKCRRTTLKGSGFSLGRGSSRVFSLGPLFHHPDFVLLSFTRAFVNVCYCFITFPPHSICFISFLVFPVVCSDFFSSFGHLSALNFIFSLCFFSHAHYTITLLKRFLISLNRENKLLL